MDHPTTPRPGAQRGNQNAVRHGLVAGDLPKDAKYIRNRINGFRRQLEAAVIAVKNEITLTDAASIQTCIRWERHASLAQRWLTKSIDELSPTERLHFSREICKASSERDKAIHALRLDSSGQHALPWLQPGPVAEADGGDQ